MAIPTNHIDKITDHDSGESRHICPPAEHVSVDNENYEGETLDEVLDEVAQAIEEAGQGGYAPPQGGIPKSDLAESVQDSLDKADSALQDDDVAEVAKTGDYNDLENKPTIPDTSGLATKTELQQGLGTKQDALVAGNGIAIAQDGKTVSVAEAVRTGAGKGATAVQSVTVNGTPHTPISGNVDLGNLRGQDGNSGVASADNFESVNNLNGGTTDTSQRVYVLGANQGKRLRDQINYVYARLQAVYAALGNIAFWDGKPASATILPNLDWGLPKHTLTLNLTLSNASVKVNGTAYANGDTLSVEEYSTLSMLIEAASGHTFTTAPTLTFGGQSVTLTPNQDGSYSADVVMGQSDATLAITATAAQAYSITYGTMANCSVVTSPAPTSILGGQSVEVEFAAGSGYELDSSCFTVANADKSWSASTNKLTISNATGNVTISATAEQPKLKFLKYYWMDYTGSAPYPSKSNTQGFYGKYSVSDYIPVPQMTITSSTKWSVFYKWAAQGANTRPLIMSYYRLENGQYTYLANKTAQNQNVKVRDWTMSDTNVINACAAGTLYVRLTLGMNTNDGTGTALHADGYATVGSTDIFRVGADNYRLVDEQDWDVDELNLS